MNSWTRKENSHHYSTEIFTLVVNDITLNRQLWFPNNSWKWWIRLKDLKVAWLLARIWSNHRNFLALLKGQLTENKVGVSANIISKGCWQNRRNKGSNFKSNLGNEVTTGKLHLNSRVKSLIDINFTSIFSRFRFHKKIRDSSTFCFHFSIFQLSRQPASASVSWK